MEPLALPTLAVSSADGERFSELKQRFLPSDAEEKHRVTISYACVDRDARWLASGRMVKG